MHDGQAPGVFEERSEVRGHVQGERIEHEGPPGGRELDEAETVGIAVESRGLAVHGDAVRTGQRALHGRGVARRLNMDRRPAHDAARAVDEEQIMAFVNTFRFREGAGAAPLLFVRGTAPAAGLRVARRLSHRKGT